MKGMDEIIKEANLYKETIKEAEIEIEYNYENNQVTITVINWKSDKMPFSVKVNTSEIAKDKFSKNETTYTYTYTINKLEDEKIRAELYTTGYTVKYRKLYKDGADNQTLLVVTSINKTNEKIKEKEISLKTDISLQKYIVKVNNTDISGRNNKKTSESESNSRIVKDDGSYKAIYKNFSNNNNVSPNNSYKRNDAVPIEAGDTVTYRIYVYNNSVVNAKNVNVTDRLPYYYTGSDTNFETSGNKALAVSNKIEDIIIKDKNNNIINVKDKNNNNGYTKSDDKYGCTNLSWTINELNAKANTYFDITLKFNTYLNGKINNTAWISSTEPENRGTYRTLDRDYVEMKKYSVSLEKYVSSVNDSNIFYEAKYDVNEDEILNEDDAKLILSYSAEIKSIDELSESKKKNIDIDGDGKITSADAQKLLELIREKNKTREGHPIYNPNNFSKQNNPVRVEVGDIVTYTIKLTNTDKNNDGTSIWVSDIEDVFDGNDKAGLTYKEDTATGYGKKVNVDNSEEGKLKITIDKPDEIKPGESAYFTLKFKVEIDKENTATKQTLKNTATVTKIINKNNVVVDDSDGTTNDTDSDWIKTKLYAVSLEKYVSKVNGTSITGRRDDYPIHNKDNKANTWDNTKYNNVVTVSNGDKVTYTIKVKNDGDTKAIITNIADYFPNGVKYNEKEYTESVYCTMFDSEELDNGETKNEVDFSNEISLEPGESESFNVEVTVIEPNISNNILKNVAKITELKNKNNEPITDTTPNNNKDADYIQLDYKTPPSDEDDDYDYAIGGMVWNDMALNKAQDKYNGEKDNEESYLSGITVKLHRDGKGIVATTTTNEKGEYRFTNEDLDKSLPDNERYIKGPKENGTNRWDGSYYSYYVIFEYDGITYTSTEYKEFGCADDTELKSNAMENENTRTTFNNQFSTINSESAINYATVNEEGYIPQSKHIYNSSMAMQSSTIKIELKNDTTLENNLKHVNLGLRGRDIFDLELTSDVYSTKVTVNGVDGTYNYNSNKVTVRRNDLNNYNYREDSANTYAQSSKYEGDSYEQIVRQSDITNNAYDNTGLEIEVTYKLTVKNASNTKGTATKITNYYDKNYTFEGAYSDSSCSNKLSDATVSTGNNYNSVIITTQGTQLNQSETMDIYVVYTLNNPVDLLKDLDIGKKLPTYNMAEITEYTTSCGKGQTEFTRGLLDKDSAPGSVATEKVRLTPNLIGTQTTIEYYFGGNDLSKLKYEDDTYATPTLYFVKDDNERTITGTVFEDEIIPSDKTTKIKTGNGKLDDGEVGVYGATVQLIELPKENEENKLSSSRYSVQTDKDGKFEISGFLPGNYIIRYSYGNTVDTVLINTLNNESPKINSKSYNGEDFQATNNGLNAHPDNAKYIDPKLSNLENYWYAINETDKISTGFDDSSRRLIVSNNVIESDEIMTVLNNMRDGNSKDDCKVTYTDSTSKEININVSDVIEKTCMWADTQQMLLTVEETIDLNGGYNTSDIEGKYKIIDKDNNIATWTIFPNEKDEHYKEYKIENMNFGIAEVPVTSIDLSKKLNKFIITDSTGQNVIASFNMDEKKGKVGFVTVADEADGRYWAQIEDEKLQGARLEITYDIRIDMNTEINFDVKGGAIPTITEIVDFIDNSLSYNENLGQNKDNWEVTTYNGDGGLFKTLEKMKFTVDGKDTTTPKGTVDPNGEKYTTIIKATDKNQLLLTTDGTVTVPITLEKVLSSTNSTIEEIITSTVQSYEYSNTVEIVGIDYSNTKTGVTDETTGTRLEVMRDRVRTKDRYIILPGVQHDSATSETLVITPPTGDSSISITYYIIAVISLAVLAVGVFGIKKFVIKK